MNYLICGQKTSLSTCRWFVLSFLISRSYLHQGFNTITVMKNVLLAHEPVGFAWIDCYEIQQRRVVNSPLYTSLCTISVKPLIIRVGNRTPHQPLRYIWSHHLIVFIKAFSFNSSKPKSSRFEVTHNPRSCSTIGCIPTQSIASMHTIVGLATIIAVARIWTSL